MSLRSAVLAFPLLIALLCPCGLYAEETPDAWLDRMAVVVPSQNGIAIQYLLIQYRNGQRVDASGTTRYHVDGKRFVNEIKTQAAGIEVDVRMVCDGATVWTEVREGTTVRSVQKFSCDTLVQLGGGSGLDPKMQVQELRRRYDLTRVQDGKLGDQAVKILEGTLRPEFVAAQLKVASRLGREIAVEVAKPQLESMARARVYVDPATAQFRKTELLDEDGQIVLSFEITGLQTGVTFDEALFAYAPPANAEVMDLDSAFKGKPSSP